MEISKIARLPKRIREQLNRRLEDGQPGSEVLPWLNELPRVKKILAAQFAGHPVNDQNLSTWRHSGYQRWLDRREPLDDLRLLAEEARDISRVTSGSLARGVASITAGKIFRMLDALPPDKWSTTDLAKIAYAATALFNADQGQVRLRHDKTRVRLRHEQVTLQWDKHQRDRVAVAQRVLNDAQIKAIQESDLDNSLKIELLGQRLFGELWQGREVAPNSTAEALPKGP